MIMTELMEESEVDKVTEIQITDETSDRISKFLDQIMIGDSNPSSQITNLDGAILGIISG